MPIKAGFVGAWPRATKAGIAAPNPPRIVMISRRLIVALRFGTTVW